VVLTSTTDRTLLVAEPASHIVRAITPAGLVTTLVGVNAASSLAALDAVFNFTAFTDDDDI
jgi:hypothetical protein